jgi:hypothetical protein
MKKVGNLYGKIWATLRHPMATCQAARNEGLGETAIYALAPLSVPAVLLAIGGAIIYPRFMSLYLGNLSSIGWLSIPFLVITLLAGGFVGLAIIGIVLHIPVRVLGGNGSLNDSLRITVYCATPLVLSLWFPPFVVITAVWSAILGIFWVHETHKLSIWKATTSVLLLPISVIILALGVRALS